MRIIINFFICFSLLIYLNQSYALQASNGVVDMGISLTRGGSIDSLKVLGQEVIDAGDLGREIQASVFIVGVGQSKCYFPDGIHWIASTPGFNPQEAGDQYGNRSPIVAYSTAPDGYLNVRVQARNWGGWELWDSSIPTSQFLPGYFTIEGNHKIGPLPYSNHKEAIRLRYNFKLESGAPTSSITFATNQIKDYNCNSTPTSFVPAIYFKGNILTRLFGLSLTGSSWIEVTNNTNISAGPYTPTLYHYRAMAWMKSDLTWGVAAYSRPTLNQAVNFAAIRFPSLNLSLLNVVNQNLGTLGLNQSKAVLTHLAVGNLDLIKQIVNEIYAAGQ